MGCSGKESTDGVVGIHQARSRGKELTGKGGDGDVVENGDVGMLQRRQRRSGARRWPVKGPAAPETKGEGEVHIIYRGRARQGGAHRRDGVAAVPWMLFGEQRWFRGARRTKGKGGVLGRPWSALVVEISSGDGGGWWWGSLWLELKWGEEKEGVGGSARGRWEKGARRIGRVAERWMGGGGGRPQHASGRARSWSGGVAARDRGG
jgi:hypothetical protein